MDRSEKNDYEVSSGESPNYPHDGETVDMRGRQGSVVKNEAAELYGDIQTAERESSASPSPSHTTAPD